MTHFLFTQLYGLNQCIRTYIPLFAFHRGFFAFHGLLLRYCTNEDVLSFVFWLIEDLLSGKLIKAAAFV